MRPRSDGEFAKAMTGVEPLRPSRRASVQAPRKAVLPSKRTWDGHDTLQNTRPEDAPAHHAFESGGELVFVRHGLSRDVLRKLRRGHWLIEDALDLHGLNRLQASEMLTGFLRRCRQRSVRCIRIVHGKGHRSRNREPVLKGRVGAWLAASDDVLAFCQAAAAQGGAGAVLVLLRGRDRG